MAALKVFYLKRGVFVIDHSMGDKAGTEGMDFVIELDGKFENVKFDRDLYDLVHEQDDFPVDQPLQMCENVYRIFNCSSLPADKGVRSMSVGDVVAIEVQDSEFTHLYVVRNMGFEKVQ